MVDHPYPEGLLRRVLRGHGLRTGADHRLRGTAGRRKQGNSRPGWRGCGVLRRTLRLRLPVRHGIRGRGRVLPLRPAADAGDRPAASRRRDTRSGPQTHRVRGAGRHRRRRRPRVRTRRAARRGPARLAGRPGHDPGRLPSPLRPAEYPDRPADLLGDRRSRGVEQRQKGLPGARRTGAGRGLPAAPPGRCGAYLLRSRGPGRRRLGTRGDRELRGGPTRRTALWRWSWC